MLPAPPLFLHIHPSCCPSPIRISHHAHHLLLVHSIHSYPISCLPSRIVRSANPAAESIALAPTQTQPTHHPNLTAYHLSHYPPTAAPTTIRTTTIASFFLVAQHPQTPHLLTSPSYMLLHAVFPYASVRISLSLCNTLLSSNHLYSYLDHITFSAVQP